MDKRVLFFLGGNLVRLSLLLVAVSTISFILLANSPIDPIDAYFINKAASAEQHALVAAYWGFDKPPLERFLIWAGNILHGTSARRLSIVRRCSKSLGRNSV